MTLGAIPIFSQADELFQARYPSVTCSITFRQIDATRVIGGAQEDRRKHLAISHFGFADAGLLDKVTQDRKKYMKKKLFSF